MQARQQNVSLVYIVMVTLPLFPLSIVVFPGEELKLHIFEPRYQQLVHDCNKDDITFGIPPYLDGKSLKYGTELRLTEISKTYADGKIDIQAKGIGWFVIDDFFRIMHGKLYPGGNIQRMSWTENADIVYSTLIVTLIEDLYKTMKINNIQIPTATKYRTFHLAHKIGLNIEQELQLLTISNEVDRQVFIIEHLEHLLPIVKDAENLRKRAELNGHFQLIIPPEI